jgi:hypothetical protein
VFLIQNRSEYLGHVRATTLETAQTEAVKLFGLTEVQRKRLLLRERL